MMRKLLPVVLIGTALLSSCSSSLSPQPPETVTSEAWLGAYQKALEGDIPSLKSVANCYKQGLNGFPKSARKAANCWEQAAMLGDVESQRNLGYACLKGVGRLESRSSAKKWFEMAAVNGDYESAQQVDKINKKILEEKEEDARKMYLKRQQAIEEQRAILNMFAG